MTEYIRELVRRLRATGGKGQGGPLKAEAADEIERLTAERDKWKLQAQYETDTAQAAIDEIERLFVAAERAAK